MKFRCGSIILLLTLAGGCAPKSAKPAAAADAPNTGLEILGSESGEQLTLLSSLDPSKPLTDEQKGALANQAAADLEAYLNRRETPAPEPSGAGLADLGDVGSAPTAAPAAAPTADAATDAGLQAAVEPAPVVPVAPAEADERILKAADDAWASAAPRVTPGGTPSVARKPSDDPLVGLAMKMAALLREPEGTRIADAVALAAIEGVKPGVLADLESPGSALGGHLPPEDRETLLKARERVLAQPSAANEALVKSLAKITSAVPMKISKAALCRKVSGFGRYEPFESDTFLAGRPIRIIVYTELDSFAYRPAREGDPAQPGAAIGEQYTAELTQSLTLYHDPSGLQAWHKPAQRVVETTRGKRRDFYLIHQVELPGTLTVGRYMLKTTVLDKTTGASDEVNIPINVVADPRLTGRK